MKGKAYSDEFKEQLLKEVEKIGNVTLLQEIMVFHLQRLIHGLKRNLIIFPPEYHNQVISTPVITVKKLKRKTKS